MNLSQKRFGFGSTFLLPRDHILYTPENCRVHTRNEGVRDSVQVLEREWWLKEMGKGNPKIQPLRERISPWASFSTKRCQQQVNCIYQVSHFLHLLCHPPFEGVIGQGSLVSGRGKTDHWGEETSGEEDEIQVLKSSNPLTPIKSRAWRFAPFRGPKFYIIFMKRGKHD